MSTDPWVFLAPYWPDQVWAQVAATLIISVLLALFASFVLRVVVARIVSRTATDLDDLIIAAIERPAVWSLVAVGSWYALLLLEPPAPFPYFLQGGIMTGVVVSWTYAGSTVVDLLLATVIKHQGRTPIINPRTVPLFKMVGKAVLVATTAYFFFLAWDLDLTGWLASAGVIGIAVGFAAKDSLANLFAGVSIIADAPYKLGDYLQLETGERGRVSEIGIRSTRIITLDEIEIILPNSVMANARIINESGGPGLATRLSTEVEVSYSSDVDQVRAVLTELGTHAAHVHTSPAPLAHFRAFGASGLVFELRVWVDHPRNRTRVLDALNTAIYKRFNEEGIEIPFSKHDVYLYPQAPKDD